VKESTVFTRKYCTELTNLSMLSVFEVEVWCFRGGNDIPKWINRHDGTGATSATFSPETEYGITQINSRHYASSKPTFHCSMAVQNQRLGLMERNIGRSFSLSRFILGLQSSKQG